MSEERLLKAMMNIMEEYGMPKFSDNYPAKDILQLVKDILPPISHAQTSQDSDPLKAYANGFTDGYKEAQTSQKREEVNKEDIISAILDDKEAMKWYNIENGNYDPLAECIVSLLQSKHYSPPPTVTLEEIEELLGATIEFVQWFDYLSAYQHENLVNGQTLETASENWCNMQTPNPSPSIERMRLAIAALKEKWK